ncbi:hypothetical protein Scep_009439 [Stephania cephalantha]|uniref:Uncharacterized protein n=1 Tax=Stephania cephalantha TaxID=152367 RepID=A0AAP0JUM5_9MAGN
MDIMKEEMHSLLALPIKYKIQQEVIIMYFKIDKTHYKYNVQTYPNPMDVPINYHVNDKLAIERWRWGIT